jgi:hypothetical protein
MLATYMLLRLHLEGFGACFVDECVHMRVDLCDIQTFARLMLPVYIKREVVLLP